MTILIAVALVLVGGGLVLFWWALFRASAQRDRAWDRLRPPTVSERWLSQHEYHKDGDKER